jgi:hypothetical protein
MDCFESPADEIEVTPEMVAAGIFALENGYLSCDHLSQLVLPEAVSSVFRAMLGVRTSQPIVMKPEICHNGK